ncbi:hypothetical protein OH77DRAFT_1421369 [Trametes cingulata]|nr:hypothetical protein OH77DRAFT_1421369 [Trametes cingulata]
MAKASRRARAPPRTPSRRMPLDLAPCIILYNADSTHAAVLLYDEAYVVEVFCIMLKKKALYDASRRPILHVD